MGLLKRLTSLFSPPAPRAEANFYTFKVQCLRCGETIDGKVNLYNDLSIEYAGEDGQGPASYVSRKVLVGTGRCFQQIEVQLTFDGKRNLMERQISGGKFLDE